MSTRVRSKVLYYCKTCDGKLVDERTRNRHDELEKSLASSISGFIPSLPSSHIRHSTIAKESGPSRTIRAVEQELRLPDDDNYYELTLDDFDQYLPLKKRRRQDSFQEVEAILEGDDDGDVGSVDDKEVNDDDDDDNDEEDDGGNDDNDKEEYDSNDDDYEQFDALNTTFDYDDYWIILWILKYQSRFRLPDVAINALIKFF